MNREAGSIVRQAAKAIERFGWRQGHEGSPEVGMCIRGALFYVQAKDRGRQLSSDWKAEEVFSEWMGENGFYQEIHEASSGQLKNIDLTPYWNDWKGRTKEEVLLYMNKFADEVDPQGP